MSEKEQPAKPATPRQATPRQPERRAAAAAEDGGITVKKDGSISIKTGTIIAIVGAVLGTGGATGLGQILDRPSPTVLKALEEQTERLEAIEAQQGEQADLAESNARLTRIIYRSIIRAHPDAAVSLEDLDMDP